MKQIIIVLMIGLVLLGGCTTNICKTLNTDDYYWKLGWDGGCRKIEVNEIAETNITLFDWFPKNHTCFTEGNSKTHCDKITFENGSELLINCLTWSGGYTIRCINTTNAKVEKNIEI